MTDEQQDHGFVGVDLEVGESTNIQTISKDVGSRSQLRIVRLWLVYGLRASRRDLLLEGSARLL